MNPAPASVVNGPSNGRGGAHRLRWWSLVALSGAVLICFAMAPDLFRSVGVNHLAPWFLDFYAILAAYDAAALVLDPYASNPLDYFGRGHSYARWWLGLGRIGSTRADTLVLEFALAAAFYVSAVAALRPRRWAEVVWALGVLCSPPVLLALDRANIDLAVFVLLAPGVPCLLSSRSGVRWLAVPPIIAAAALKGYHLWQGTFREVIAVQTLRPTSANGDMGGDPNDLMPPTHRLEPIAEKRLGGRWARQSWLVVSDDAPPADH